MRIIQCVKKKLIRKIFYVYVMKEVTIKKNKFMESGKNYNRKGTDINMMSIEIVEAHGPKTPKKY